MRRYAHILRAFASTFRDAERTNTVGRFISLEQGHRLKHILAAATAVGAVGVVVYELGEQCSNGHFPNLVKTCQLEAATILPGVRRTELPTFSMEQVQAHGKDAPQIWVTYKEGVYDVTDFVKLHPGGDKILLAAGNSIAPFWAIYAQHNTEEVWEILEELRIGNLAKEDADRLAAQQQATAASADDPYGHDPVRHPALLVNMQKPFNAESPPSLLVDDFITPNQLFFVRNHMPVPQTSEETHCLQLEGLGISKPISLSLDELRTKFEPVTVTSAVQCAGNRRNDMNEYKKVQGLMWTGTAISNAKWKGCRLRDVLISAGVSPNDERIKHVQFEGADMDSTGSHYGASITFEKAMRPEVILAYEMNGEPIPRDHGYPLRAVVPGVVGARQVKWLRSVRTSAEESDTIWQRKDYRAMPLHVQIGDTPPFDTVPAIQEYPVQSAICAPAPNARIGPDTKSVQVAGYAWSGGGRGIIRVEVSADGGRTWKCADLEQCPEQDVDHMWAWTLWQAELPVPAEQARTGRLELVCKATDRAYNTQPETSAGLWNVRGLLNNAWHRVPLLVDAVITKSLSSVDDQQMGAATE